jgi:hypothetical protein
MNWARALTRDDILENIAQYRDDPEFVVWRDSYLAKAVADLDVKFVRAMLEAGAGPDLFESWRDSLQHFLAHMYYANRSVKGDLILEVLGLIYAHGADPNYVGRLTPRSSGRVRDKVPSSDAGARAAQLNR